MERSDASFQQCIMPHGTTAENCDTRSNTAETADFSSNWKSAETADFPSRWKFRPYRQQNGGGITMIPPPRSLRRAYAVSCRETKNPNPLPMANRFGFLDFGTPEGTRTPSLQNRNLTLYPIALRAHLTRSFNVPDYYSNHPPVCKELILIFPKKLPVSSYLHCPQQP